MTRIKVYWEFGECKAFLDEKPDVIGSGRNLDAAVGNVLTKLGLVTVEVIKKVPVSD